METLLDIPPTLTSVHINPHTCFSYLSSTPCSRVHTYMRQPSRTSICQGVGWAYLANMGSRGRATSRKWEWISGTESSLYPRRESGIPERESTLASRPPVQESNTYFWQFIPNVGSRWVRRSGDNLFKSRCRAITINKKRAPINLRLLQIRLIQIYHQENRSVLKQYVGTTQSQML